MIVIPAVDIKDGKCVRLLQGRMEDETIYSTNPWEMALKWQRAGAGILHVVDLNGAFEGRGVNDDAVREIIEHVDMDTELGGGIRDMARIDNLLKMGISRVIIGTAAVENPALVREAIDTYGPEKIVVGIDATDGIAKTRGWAADGGRPAVGLALEMKKLGVTRIVYTDISRDGMLIGPNIEETERMARETGLKIVASGGVSSLDDIWALKPLEFYGVDSVITGKALYEKKFTLKEAIQIADMSPLVENGFLGSEYEYQKKHIKIKYKELFNYSEYVNKICHKILTELKIHNDDSKEIVVSSLYIKSLSAFQSVIILSTNGMGKEGNIINRSLIELTFKINAINKKDDYLIRYLIRGELEKLRLLKKMEKYESWHSLLGGSNKLKEQTIIQEKIYEDLLKINNVNKRDIKELSTEKIAKEAELAEQYYIIYSLLCSDIHSNPEALKDYFSLNYLDEIRGIKYGPNDRDIDRVLSTSIHAMLIILDSINILFQLNEESLIKKLEQRFIDISKKSLKI